MPSLATMRKAIFIPQPATAITRTIAIVVLAFAASAALAATQPLPMHLAAATGAAASAGVATPGASQGPGDAATPADSRACLKAKSKVAREQRSVAKVQKAINRARTNSTQCSTKPVCDRYATKIEELEARRARHDAKLAKLKATAGKICPPA